MKVSDLKRFVQSSRVLELVWLNLSFSICATVSTPGEVPVIQTPPVGENLAAMHELPSEDQIVYVYMLLTCFCTRVFVVFNNLQFSQGSGLFSLLSTIFKSRDLSNVGKVHTDLRVYRPCQRRLDVRYDPLPRFHRGSGLGGIFLIGHFISHLLQLLISHILQRVISLHVSFIVTFQFMFHL